MAWIRKKQSFCILLLFLAALTASGCRKKAPVVVPAAKTTPTSSEAAPAPPQAITPEPPQLPGIGPASAAKLPKKVPMPDYFESAERSFKAGKYQEAAQAYETFLKTDLKAKERDQALFHLGLSRALADDSARDWRQAEAALRTLISEFPQSSYRGPAEWILGIQGQIEKLRTDVKERDEKIRRLSEELQKLKAIDMQRRPSK